MKTVEYYGKTFEVPDWAQYIVAEADGSVWGYVNEPVQTFLEAEGDVEWYPTEGVDCFQFQVLHGVEFPCNDGKTYKSLKV